MLGLTPLDADSGRLLAKRGILALVGAFVGAIVGILFSLIIFFWVVSLIALGSHGGGVGNTAREAFPVVLLGIGLPCLIAGSILFAYAPTRMGALLVRLAVSTAAATAYGIWRFGDSELGVAFTAIIMSVPFWFLCLLSLGVGFLFLRPKASASSH